ASIAGSARISSRLSFSAMPCSAQNASALPRVRVCPAVKRKAALLPCAALTSVRPHRPIPTIAARIILFPPESDAAFYTLPAAAVTQVARGVHDISHLGAVESDPPPAM